MSLFFRFLFYLLKRIITNFSFILGLIIVSIIIFLIYQYNKHYSIEDIIEPSFKISEKNDDSQKANNNLIKHKKSIEDIINEVEVKSGDSFISLLKNQKISQKDKKELIILAKNNNIKKYLKPGQKIKFEYNIELNETNESDLVKQQYILKNIDIDLNQKKKIQFIRQDDNKFTLEHIETSYEKYLTKIEATVTNSLLSALKKHNIPSKDIIRLVNAYNHKIDFQRQLQKGDKISILIERFITQDKKFSHYGDIIFSSLKNKNKNYELYYFDPNKNQKNKKYYSRNGENIKKFLLKTPVKIIRISSKYGYRKHPVLGYNKLHKGVDFAGPTGTPIMSSGDGVVKFIGWQKGYGRFVEIRHNKNLCTGYAHASRFAKNLKKGDKVKQGQVIAYIGMSGRVTGPHLHYEVRINGKPVDPLKYSKNLAKKSGSSYQLKGDQFELFNNFKNKIKDSFNKMKHNQDIIAN